jgi:hypothetical protein
VLAPAFQLVRRPVVQMVGSRHSSPSHPSTTVRATVASPWSWTAVTSPAGQATSHASTSGVTSSGIDQGRSGGPSSRVGSFANRVVSSTSSASGQAGPGRAVSTERMVVLCEWSRPAHGSAAARGERRTRGPARASGSPQRVGRAGRRAWGHAQDPFSLGVRRGSRPRAFRCGMATRRVPFRPPPVKPTGAPPAPLSDRNQPVALWLPDRPGRLGRFGYVSAGFGAYVPRCTAFRYPTSA